jgi:mannose-1-phosphate guanylyltransferase/phosphomannomutase
MNKSMPLRTAVVLAGGYGTRLYPLTQTRAKSLLPLAGVPLMRRLLTYLEKNGFDRIVVTLSNFSDQIKQDLKSFECKADLKFSEEQTPKGTAGSVRNARRHLKDSFLVIQGDTVTDIDLSRPIGFHSRHGEVATILLKERNDVTGLGVVDLDPLSNISRFAEKPSFSEEKPRLVSTGIYLLEPEVMDHIPKGRPFDFAKDLFPKLLQEQRSIKGLQMGGYWVDVGTPKAYRDASMWTLQSLVRNGDLKHPIAGNSAVGEGAVVHKGALVERCVLESGVTVANGAVLRDSVILERTTVDAWAVVDSAIIGEDCHVGRGAWIGAEAVLGGRVEVMPNTAVGRNSVISAISIVGADRERMGDLPFTGASLAK